MKVLHKWGQERDRLWLMLQMGHIRGRDPVVLLQGTVELEGT